MAIRISNSDKHRIFEAIKPAYYEGFTDIMNLLPRRLYDIAKDLLTVVEQEPWRTWEEVLKEVLDY